MPSAVARAALPIPPLIHYLWCNGTHRSRNKHSAHFGFFCFVSIAQICQSCWHSDCCRSTWGQWQRRAWPLTRLAPYTAALTPPLSRLQVARGHDGVGGPARCAEQLKQTWAKKYWMASVGSASLTSPATTTTGYATSRCVHGHLRSLTFKQCFYWTDSQPSAGGANSSLRWSLQKDWRDIYLFIYFNLIYQLILLLHFAIFTDEPPQTLPTHKRKHGAWKHTYYTCWYDWMLLTWLNVSKRDKFCLNFSLFSEECPDEGLFYGVNAFLLLQHTVANCTT